MKKSTSRKKNYSTKPDLYTLPGNKGCALFTPDSAEVFREEKDIYPVGIDNNREYFPWGLDNEMPYRILDLIESDETVSTCSIFNAEICYGAGLEYVSRTPASQSSHDSQISSQTSEAVEDFTECNAIDTLYMGHCFDIKTFGFCVAVIILNQSADKIVSVARREAMYCRFSPMRNGKIRHIHYANWRQVTLPDQVETIELLDMRDPYHDLCDRLEKGTKVRKFAIVSKLPTVDSTYYPIPYWASLFKGSWYKIKRDIGIAKLAKLRNTAPIRYHIEVSDQYWARLCQAEGITKDSEKLERIARAKEEIIDFLSGLENSGKVWFSQYYVTPDGREQHDVKINKIDNTKEGGDWESDIQEAVNMICFTMRVHSNLLGSVPGKAQTNNSGSDKRELYTIAQASQKMYRDAIFRPHRLIIRYNRWTGYRPECPFIQLTTLDQHTDAVTTTI